MKTSLDNLENEIKRKMRCYRSDDILLSIRNALCELSKPNSMVQTFFPQGLPSFVAAGTSIFAILYSNLHRHSENISWSDLTNLCKLVSEYLLADPIGFDKECEKDFIVSNPCFAVLRIFGNQAPFDYNSYASYSQTMKLYYDIAPKVSKKRATPFFDFHKEFNEMVGAPLKDFLSIGFVSFCASYSSPRGFTRGYFEKARSQGITLPDDPLALTILNNLSATPDKIREVYNKRKVQDRRFRAYDFNPLLTYPIIRPWKNRYILDMDNDRFVAPIPALINYRISTGIFYQMFNKFGESFSTWFGYVFEEYIGEILRNSIEREKLFTEEIVKKAYRGKVPDYEIVNGSTLILIEAKAVRLARQAVTTAFEDEVNNSLKQIIKGLKQMFDFQSAVQRRLAGLNEFHHCKKIISVLVTHEYFYTINSVLFRNHVNGLLEKEGINNFSWYVLSVQQLEVLQPYFSSKNPFPKVIKDIIENTYDEVLNKLIQSTGKTYKDSFLYKKDKEMFARLGV